MAVECGKSGEDGVLVLSEDGKEREQAQDELTKLSAKTSDKISLGLQNPPNPAPCISAESDDKDTASEGDASVEKSQSTALQSKHNILIEEQIHSSSKSNDSSSRKESGKDGTDGSKAPDETVKELNDGQELAAGKVLDKGGDTREDTGNESADSDRTIVMDTDNIEKSVDKDGQEDQATESAGKILETHGTGGDSNVKSVDVDNKEQNQKEEQQKGGPSGESKVYVSESIRLNTTPAKKDEGARGTFRSLDLPIHPGHETRRSRARQRSEEHPLERSPSVASNRSDDSAGSANRQRKRQSVEYERERRKSGASSSTKGGVRMVRPGFEFKAGFKLQAQDFSDKWYSAKIVEVDEEDGTVLIHFDGWNSRFDEWLDYKSDRLRPAPRRENSPEKSFSVGETVLARWSDTRYYQGKIRGSNPNGSYRVRFYDGLEKSVQAGNIREMPEELRPIVSPKGYGIGDEVLARWNDCRYYPAKILSIKKNGAFKVLFYDGIEKSVQPFNVREMPADLKAQDFFKQFKAQIKASEEKNRKREKRKREEAAAEEVASSSSGSSQQQAQRLKRKFSPPPLTKRARYDSGDSSKTGSSIAEEKDVGHDKDVEVEETGEETGEESKRVLPWKEFVEETNKCEHEVRKVILRRGLGYYINNFIYIKNRDSSIGMILRCQNRNQCHAKAIIKKNGKAVIKTAKHSHGAPLFKDIIFCDPGAADAADTFDQQNISTESVESSPSGSQLPSPKAESSVTPVIEMLTPEELEKMKERRKHTREPLSAPKALIIDLDHNKYKCEVPECGKSFRKATLLEYHKKYYHIKQTTATAASKAISRSRKRLSTSPPTSPSSGSSSRRSSAESGTPAKVTRSQRSSAPSELGLVSPARESMSPPISSPSERKKSLDGKDRKREASGDKLPEVRVAKTPETRIPVETKVGKLPETRIPKSPETRIVRSSDGKFTRTTPESKGSRSLSAESRSSPTAEGRTRRLSAPDRTRQLSGSGVVKPPVTVPEHEDPEKATEIVEKAGSKEPEDVKLPQESPKVVETDKSVDSSKQVVATTTVTSEDRKEHAEVKVEKEREGKSSRSDRAKAKVKHKKKHKHKHDKGKDERSRDRHKGERRRKSSDKSKLSDVEAAERSETSVKKEPLDADVKVEDMSSGMEGVDDVEEEKELINCVCGYMEEEGFMLQCERCYCWQHGCCEGVNQSTAPKHYVCTFCRHPRGERVQSKYRFDQEWFNTGKLPRFKFVNQDDIPDRSSTMLTIHNLMADVHSVQDVLIGLQHKMVILKNPNNAELALWASPWRSGEEWSFDGQAPSDMDISGQDADLSNMDHSNVSNMDTLPPSVNTSMQSVEAMDTSNQDVDTSHTDVMTTDHIKITDEARTGISEEEQTAPVVPAVESTDGPKACSAETGEDKVTATETLSMSSDKTATGDEKPKPTETLATDENPKPSDSKDTSDKAKEESVPGMSATKEVESSKEKLGDQSNTEDVPSQPGTSETSDNTDKTDGGCAENKEKAIEVVSDKKDNSDTMKTPADGLKPSQDGGNTDAPSISTSSSYAELCQLDPTSSSTGSVLGMQSTKLGADEKSKPAVDEAVIDPDKPGPSGVQQVDDINQPGPSGLQPSHDAEVPQGPSRQEPPVDAEVPSGPSRQEAPVDAEVPPGPSRQEAPVDADVPGPSGVQASDLPCTSGDGDAGGSHLLSTEVKVTGSSVWTTVQGSLGSNIPSTSSAPVQRPPIPPPAVCQANLMEHIQTMHEELFDRLALIEEQIEALEAAYAQKHQGTSNKPSSSSEQESLVLKRKMAVLMADLEKLSNIDLTSHN